MAVIEPDGDRVSFPVVDLSGLSFESQFAHVQYRSSLSEMDRPEAITAAKVIYDLLAEEQRSIPKIEWTSTADPMAGDAMREIVYRSLDRMKVEDVRSFASNLNAQILMRRYVLDAGKSEFLNG